MTCLLADSMGGTALGYPLSTHQFNVGRFPWSHPSKAVAMCSACGDRPVKPRSTLCFDCAPIRKDASRARKKARERIRHGKPCRGCGGAKPPGKRVVYCARCEPEYRKPRGKATAEGVRKCERCPNPSRSKFAKLCEDCKRAAVDDQRRYRREWWRENGSRESTPRHPEATRLQSRLRAEQNGRPLPAPSPPLLRSSGSRIDVDAFPRLPAGPLAAAVGRLIRATALDCQFAVNPHSRIRGDDGQVRRPEEYHRVDASSPREVVCERLGIPSRALYDWERGVRAMVGFDVADRVVTRGGLLWFDVWPDGEGHELARRAFEGE
jgi:hypothetical protein